MPEQQNIAPETVFILDGKRDEDWTQQQAILDQSKRELERVAASVQYLNDFELGAIATKISSAHAFAADDAAAKEKQTKRDEANKHLATLSRLANNFYRSTTVFHEKFQPYKKLWIIPSGKINSDEQQMIAAIEATLKLSEYFLNFSIKSFEIATLDQEIKKHRESLETIQKEINELGGSDSSTDSDPNPDIARSVTIKKSFETEIARKEAELKHKQAQLVILERDAHRDKIINATSLLAEFKALDNQIYHVSKTRNALRILLGIAVGLLLAAAVVALFGLLMNPFSGHITLAAILAVLVVTFTGGLSIFGVGHGAMMNSSCQINIDGYKTTMNVSTPAPSMLLSVVQIFVLPFVFSKSVVSRLLNPAREVAARDVQRANLQILALKLQNRINQNVIVYDKGQLAVEVVQALTHLITRAVTLYESNITNHFERSGVIKGRLILNAIAALMEHLKHDSKKKIERLEQLWELDVNEIASSLQLQADRTSTAAARAAEPAADAGPDSASTAASVAAPAAGLTEVLSTGSSGPSETTPSGAGAIGSSATAVNAAASDANSRDSTKPKITFAELVNAQRGALFYSRNILTDTAMKLKAELGLAMGTAADITKFEQRKSLDEVLEACPTLVPKI